MGIFQFLKKAFKSNYRTPSEDFHIGYQAGYRDGLIEGLSSRAKKGRALTQEEYDEVIEFMQSRNYVMGLQVMPITMVTSDSLSPDMTVPILLMLKYLKMI